MSTPIKPVKPKTCLFPKCKNPVATRGLCKNHYSTASNLVKVEKVTWEQLEKAGKSLRPNRSGAGTIQVWFLEAQTWK